MQARDDDVELRQSSVKEREGTLGRCERVNSSMDAGQQGCGEFPWHCWGQGSLPLRLIWLLRELNEITYAWHIVEVQEILFPLIILPCYWHHYLSSGWSQKYESSSSLLCPFPFTTIHPKQMTLSEERGRSKDQKSGSNPHRVYSLPLIYFWEK